VPPHLGHCRDALADGGRVLVVEHVIPKGNGAYWGKLLDINLLALTDGLDRTRGSSEGCSGGRG
jgi:hypothetical protein